MGTWQRLRTADRGRAHRRHSISEVASGRPGAAYADGRIDPFDLDPGFGGWRDFGPRDGGTGVAAFVRG
jgi:hypothetical protein